MVVGGHTRHVGKTAFVEDVIRAFPQAHWTAVKITSHLHVAGSEDDSAGSGFPASILHEETDRIADTDTSRYLAAGARRAFWLRFQPGRLAEAIPSLQTALRGTEHAILESNAVIEFIRPQIFIMVMDSAQREFKDSARLLLDRADAFLLRRAVSPSDWGGLGGQVTGSRPIFLQPFGHPLPSNLLSLIRKSLFPAMHPETTDGHLQG